MANPDIYFFIRANRVQAFRAQLKGNPILDPANGGDFLFPVEYWNEAGGDPPDDNNRYYGSTWNLGEAQFLEMLDELSGYIVNDPNFVPGTEIAYYLATEGWTLLMAQSDTTQHKNQVLVRHVEEPEVP